MRRAIDEAHTRRNLADLAYPSSIVEADAMLRSKLQREPTVTLEFLQRTSVLSVSATALLSMWLFGNLYEAVVWNPQLISNPRPGMLVGELAVGSPVYYYLPWGPLGIIFAVILRLRFGPIAPVHVRRAWNGAIGLLVVAVITKVLLITQVNPVFRDPTVSSHTVHDQAVVWAFGNGIATVAVAAGVLLLTRWRRPGVQERPEASTAPHGQSQAVPEAHPKSRTAR
jgi:hypothetical protein